MLQDWNKKAGRAENEYLRELITGHVSGRLKVAPEHTSGEVIRLMRKAPFDLFRQLKSRFDAIIRKEQLNYEIIPYFISSHPGCTDKDMKDLVEEMKSMGIKPEQVQDFTPTPMTLSTLMYYTGYDPYTGKKVFVARNAEEKKRQKSFFFWYKDGSRPAASAGRQEVSGVRHKGKGKGKGNNIRFKKGKS